MLKWTLKKLDKTSYKQNSPVMDQSKTHYFSKRSYAENSKKCPPICQFCSKCGHEAKNCFKSCQIFKSGSKFDRKNNYEQQHLN